MVMCIFWFLIMNTTENNIISNISVHVMLHHVPHVTHGIFSSIPCVYVTHAHVQYIALANCKIHSSTVIYIIACMHAHMQYIC